MFLKNGALRAKFENLPLNVTVAFLLMLNRQTFRT